eukprot:2297041-Pyramimonas_sp.AAC.1
MLVHAPPRTIEIAGNTANSIPTRSGNLAGCIQSMCWVKMYFCDLIASAHRNHMFASPRSYVDDLSQSQQG